MPVSTSAHGLEFGWKSMCTERTSRATVVTGRGRANERLHSRGAAAAATAAAPVPCALSYILFELEPKQWFVLEQKEDFNGGPAHVT